ncbi:MAG TPA: cupin domain-containing protein [Rhodocyclaceae bacterium]|nr:cupin domain-containing protein [Rhodocyclaceae bacterium]
MPGNLFANLTTPLAEEEFTTLLQTPGVRIERIVSTGQCSPPNFWYDQPEGEWVVVLTGEARLRFADESEARHLRPGDYVSIPPHRRHRVEATCADQATVWLAIFYADANTSAPSPYTARAGSH